MSRSAQGHGASRRAGPGLAIDDQGVAVPEWALHQSRTRKHRLYLDAARTDQKVTLGAADYIWAARASSPTALAEIGLASPEAAEFPVTQGFFLRGIPFTDIYVTNGAQGGQWIDLYTGRTGAGIVSALNPGNVISTVTLSKATSGQNILHTPAIGGVTTISAANAARRRIVIYNRGPNSCRVGLASPPAAIPLSAIVGHTLNVGESVEFQTTAGITSWGLPGGTTLSAWTEED